MIDIENIVYTKVREAVLSAQPNARVINYPDAENTAFPCVTFEQTNNYVDTSSITTTELENHAAVDFEIQVYMNGVLRKSVAKSIAEVVDETMKGMRFNRTFMGQVPNVRPDIARIILRYHGIVAKGVEFDGDTIYKVYQR